MIWLRRILTAPLGLLFFVILLVTLVMLQVNDTFLNPDYYPEQLRKADIYEFVLNDLLTSALDEQRERERKQRDADDSDQIDTRTLLLSSGLTTEQIVSAVNRALPPEWAQELVERNFDEVGRYLIGERDEFAVTPAAADRVKAVVEELKSLIRTADSYEVLFQEAITPAIEKWVEKDLPLGLEVTSDRLVQAARAVIPREWVEEQVEIVLDEVTPYITGERDTFQIEVQLADRVEIALEEVQKLLRETDSGQLLYEEVVEPQLARVLGPTVALPLGLAVTEEEVLDALRQVAPPAWVEEQALMVINDAGPYLTGKSDSFATRVSLVENKRLARGVIAELVDKKVKEAVDGLPKCASLAQVRAALSSASQGLPSCVPPDIPTSELLDRLDIDIAGAIQRRVLAPIPNTITFTEVQLRTSLVQAGAAENLDQLDQIRELLKDNWTYTSAGLHEQQPLLNLRPELKPTETQTKRLDEIREFLSDSKTYTETDLRERLPGGEEGATVDDLDSGRDILKASRTYRWVIYVPLIVLLAGISFLGGRGWSGRVAWGAGALLIAAGIIFLIFGPGYDNLAKSGPIYDAAGLSDLEEQREEALDRITHPEKYDTSAEKNDYPKTSSLAANKAFDMLESMADDFASGIATSSLGFAIIGLIALAAAIFWATLMGLARRYLPLKEQDADD